MDVPTFRVELVLGFRYATDPFLKRYIYQATILGLSVRSEPAAAVSGFRSYVRNCCTANVDVRGPSSKDLVKTYTQIQDVQYTVQCNMAGAVCSFNPCSLDRAVCTARNRLPETVVDPVFYTRSWTCQV